MFLCRLVLPPSTPSGTVLAAGALAAVSTLILFARELIYGLDLAEAGAGVEASWYSVQLFGVVALMLSGRYEVTEVLIIYALAGIPILIGAAFVLSSHSLVEKGPQLAQLRPNLVSGSWQYGIRLTAQTGIQRIDRLIVAALLGTQAVAQYSATATIGELAWVVPISLSQVRFAGLARGRIGVHRVRRDLKFMIAAYVLPTALLALLAPLLVTMIFGASYSLSLGTSFVLVLGAIGYGYYAYASNVCVAVGLPRIVAAAPGFGVLVLLVLDFALIPLMGILGAAAACAIAYAVVGIPTTLGALNWKAWRVGSMDSSK
jgi:O-antigen/teichoic acid export membrane protein